MGGYLFIIIIIFGGWWWPVCACYSSTCSAFDTCPLSRYDGLVGMFDPKGRSVPCVGVSQSKVCSMKRGTPHR